MRKGRRRDTNMHAKEIRGKMKQKGTSLKKSIREIVPNFCQFSFCLSYTLAHIKKTWSTLTFIWIWRKERKKTKEGRGQAKEGVG